MANIEIALKQWEAATALLERLKTSQNRQIAHFAKKDLADLPTIKKYGILPQEDNASASSTTSPPEHPQANSQADESADEATSASSPKAPAEAPPDKRPLKFLKGSLVRVDCSQSPAAVLSIFNGTKVVKLRTENYSALVILGSEKFSCEWKHLQMSVNYKPGGKSDGDLVSLEIQ
jgi:hypothetical protein